MKSFNAGTKCTLNKPLFCPDNGDPHRASIYASSRWLDGIAEAKTRLQAGAAENQILIPRIKFPAKKSAAGLNST